MVFDDSCNVPYVSGLRCGFWRHGFPYFWSPYISSPFDGSQLKENPGYGIWNSKGPVKTWTLLQLLDVQFTVLIMGFFQILEGLNLSMDQFIDLCILSGCDYCDSIRGAEDSCLLVQLFILNSSNKKFDHLSLYWFSLKMWWCIQ